jgi:hypothetical protein
MLPDNLTLLHHGEENQRTESLRRIQGWPGTSHHIQMIEGSMDLIHHLLQPTDGKDKDDLAVKVLGIRIFNTLAVTMKLALSGYYQAAAAQLRDALETTFLLDYFTTDRNLIGLWRTLSEKERDKRFKPVVVREALDKRDGTTARKRGAAYKMFCRLASHPNPDSVTMLVPHGNTIAHCGPFLDDGGLKAIVREAALTGVQGVQMFRLLVRASEISHLRAKLTFMEAEADWAEKFYGQKRNRARLAEIRRRLETEGDISKLD